MDDEFRINAMQFELRISRSTDEGGLGDAIDDASVKERDVTMMLHKANVFASLLLLLVIVL